MCVRPQRNISVRGGNSTEDCLKRSEAGVRCNWHASDVPQSRAAAPQLSAFRNRFRLFEDCRPQIGRGRTATRLAEQLLQSLLPLLLLLLGAARTRLTPRLMHVRWRVFL